MGTPAKSFPRHPQGGVSRQRLQPGSATPGAKAGFALEGIGPLPTSPAPLATFASIKKKESQILNNRAGYQTRGIQAVSCLAGWGWTHFQDKKAFREIETSVLKTRNQQPARAYLGAPERRRRERATLASQPRAAGGCF